MKVLVTGGLGFIGSHTVVELQNEGFEVVIIDNLSNSSEEVLKGIVAISGKTPLFEKMDLRDKPSVQSFFKKHNDVAGVIHFAASKAVGESVENPLLYYENNFTRITTENGSQFYFQFFMYRLWTSRKNANYRRCICSSSDVTLWKYQTNRRRNYNRCD